MATNQYIDSLENLKEPNGTPPETRLASAVQAQGLFQIYRNADLPIRSQKRARVKGLVDGNPPYRAGDLRNAGRSRDCNVNWRIAESYLNSALSAFYDIFSEVETYAQVKLDLPNDPHCEEKSRVVTEEFDRLQKREQGFDYQMQISQYEMVLYGFGPFLFEDEFDWRARSGKCGDFYVPENAKSDTQEWEICMMRVEYLPHRLYEFIQNEETASGMGWDIPATKKAIMAACPRTETQNQNWEWYQQQLKNGSYYFSAQSKKIFTVHVWFREFPKDGEAEGKISHKVFLESQGNSTSGDVEEDAFLFKKIGQFSNWNECVHAMYYDHGGGGEHHSVTGMGVKMYSAMEYQNRLLCKMADDAFAPKTMFKPNSSSQSQKMALATFGSYAVLPNGYDMIQQAINPMMQESLAFNREISGVVASNLSQYRQNLQQESGNPITAREVDQRATEQARLGKTQLNRYYDQIDSLYAEKYRRACSGKLTDSMPGGKEANDFIKRCERKGVTKEDLKKVECVRATRIVGQGSPFLRQQALEFILGMVSMLPEEGRTNLMNDVIAARVGNYAVKRYNPQMEESKMASEQLSQAMDKVAGMKVGVPAVVTSMQNPVVYAQAYLNAGSQAAASLEQGANPQEVFSFLELCGVAIAAQLERIKSDKTRKSVYDALVVEFQKLSKIHDQLGQQIQENARAQQEQAAEMQAAQQKANAIASGADPSIKIKAAETQAKIRMTQEKTDASLAMKQQKHNQNMALSDATTASKISSEN